MVGIYFEALGSCKLNWFHGKVARKYTEELGHQILVELFYWFNDVITDSS